MAAGSTYVDLAPRFSLCQKDMAPVDQYSSLTVEPHESIPFVLTPHIENSERTHRWRFGQLYTEFACYGFSRLLRHLELRRCTVFSARAARAVGQQQAGP